jgi:hypothetical protein
MRKANGNHHRQTRRVAAVAGIARQRVYPRVLIGLSPDTNKQLVIEYLALCVEIVMHPDTIKSLWGRSN